MATAVPRDASADPDPGSDTLVIAKERENESGRMTEGEGVVVIVLDSTELGSKKKTMGLF